MRGPAVLLTVFVVCNCFVAKSFPQATTAELEKRLDLNILIKQARAEAARWMPDAELILVQANLEADGILTAERLARKPTFVGAIFFSVSAMQNRIYTLAIDQTWIGRPPQRYRSNARRVSVPDDADFDIGTLIARSPKARDRPQNNSAVYILAQLAGHRDVSKGVDSVAWLVQWFELVPIPRTAHPAIILGRVEAPVSRSRPGTAKTWRVDTLTVTESPLGAVPAEGKELATVRFAADLSQFAYISGGELTEDFANSSDSTGDPVIAWNGVAGRPSMKFSRRESPAFSAKGGHMAYVSLVMGQPIVVLDGSEHLVPVSLKPEVVDFVERLQLSPDGSRVAYVTTRYDKKSRETVFQTFLNGEPAGPTVSVAPPEDASDPQRGGLVGPPLFSPDGRRMAYAVYSEREGGDHVVVDGIPGPSLPAINWESVQFTADGQDILYLARRGDEFLLLRNEKVQRRFKARPVIADVSIDGKRVALKVGGSSSETLVIEGGEASFESEPFVAIDGVGFSPDGRRFAARVEFEDKSMAGLVDGRIGPRYERVSPPVFTADSAHVLHAVQLKGAWRISTDDRPGESTYEGIEELTVSRAGNHVAFRTRAKEGEGESLVADDVELFRGKEIRNLTFSPNGKVLACVAREKDGPPNAIFNGIRVGEIPAIKGQLRFVDDSTLRFVTMHDDRIWKVDVQVRTERP